MSEENKVTSTVIDVPDPVTPAPANPKLLDVDRLTLELAKEQRKTALAEAKTAVANSEKAELTFRYIVLQLYYKYGLDSNDAITENGEIAKGGAVQQAPQGK